MPPPASPSALKKTPFQQQPGRGGATQASGIEGLALAVDRRSSVADQVHAALRRAIIEVRLAPGAPISENSICRQFAVSRTPVRAAIQRLSEEGLVDVYPQLGSFVSPIRLAGLQDSHFVRRSLEVALLREVATRWTDAMSSRMREAIAEQERVIAADDADGFFYADEAFHRLLTVFAGREGVWQAIQAAKLPLTRFHRYSAKPERLQDVVTEHLAVVDALDRGDAAGAEKALVTHLDMVFVIFEALPEEERQHLSL